MGEGAQRLKTLRRGVEGMEESEYEQLSKTIVKKIFVLKIYFILLYFSLAFFVLSSLFPHHLL